MKVVGPPPFRLPPRYVYDNETLAGGQGVVYVCRDGNLERRVAIKSLHNVGDITSLLIEITARGMIRSKHVVEIYEVLHSARGKPLALVLEYIAGDTLIDKSKLPKSLHARMLLLYQLACALEDIHAANVIHRDIKPGNMKVDGNGILKIFDLGISNLDADSASTVGGAGTLVYRAPELYATPPIAVTRAVDIYAFGVVAWHFLAPAFPQALLDLPPLQAGNPLPSIATVDKSYKKLAPIIDRSLLLDPNDRPSAKELKDNLVRLLTHGRHRAQLSHGGRYWELDAPGTIVTLARGSNEKLKIGYDGDDFFVKEVDGDVFVNNKAAGANDRLPGSCVLTFGKPDQGAARMFVPFNSSEPEIVL